MTSFFFNYLFLKIFCNKLKKFSLRKVNLNYKSIRVDETFNIGKYFTYEDKQSVLCRSNVVHKITCIYGESWIEQTKNVEIKEHNPGLSKKKNTDVSNHLIKIPDDWIDFNDNISAHSGNRRNLIIQETLLIQNQNLSETLIKVWFLDYSFNT